MEKIPTVGSCCWFFDVETGTKIIGYLQAVAYAIWFTTDVIELITFKKDGRSSFWNAVVFGLVLDAILFFIAILLLIGVYKNRQRYIKTWLVAMSFIIILLVIQLIMIIFTFNVARIISEIISICLLSYAVIVVISFSRAMPSDSAPTTY